MFEEESGVGGGWGGGAWWGEVEEAVEEANVAGFDDGDELQEDVAEGGAFGAGDELDAGHTAEGEVRGDEVDEDETAVFEELSVALTVGGFKDDGSAEEVVVGEVVAAEVVQVGDPLGGGGSRRVVETVRRLR